MFMHGCTGFHKIKQSVYSSFLVQPKNIAMLAQSKINLGCALIIYFPSKSDWHENMPICFIISIRHYISKPYLSTGVQDVHEIWSGERLYGIVLTLIDSIETTYFYKVHFSDRLVRHTSSIKCLQPENKRYIYINLRLGIESNLRIDYQFPSTN